MKWTQKKLVTTSKTMASGAPRSFNFQEFRRSFQSLDNQNYGSWPMPVKVTLIVFIVVLISVLAWALPISSKIEQIKAAELQQATLLEAYQEKETKARHLDTYRLQVQQMDNEFKALLDQLPKDTRVSELVEGINMTGVGSNIRFQDISVEEPIEQEFFIEQPIRIAALGEYHQFGAFISGLAALPRIFTMHDFEVSNPQPSLDKLPELTLILNTKTYHSKEVTDKKAKDTDNSVDDPAATEGES